MAEDTLDIEPDAADTPEIAALKAKLRVLSDNVGGPERSASEGGAAGEDFIAGRDALSTANHVRQQAGEERISARRRHRDPGARHLIADLQSASLTATCPRCYGEFGLEEATMFDGTGAFPPEAESVKLAYDAGLDERIAGLQRQQAKADTGAERKAASIGVGKVVEKVLPACRNFEYPAADCRFLAEPIDMIVFRGASEMAVSHITFMDVKTGESRLNAHQRQVRDAVNDGRVRFEGV